MSFKIIASTDEHMTRPKISAPREAHFYPSESSAIWTDGYGSRRVIGGCLRSSYYRLTGEETPAPNTPYTEWIFALGKAVEEILVEQWKQMGIWVANNVKFYNSDRNISGEVDCFVSDPETHELIICEIKSVHGYYAKKDIMGNKGQRGAPKTEHMMQLMLYLDQFKNITPNGKLVYYSRDDDARKEFDITLVDDNGLHRPAINNVIDYRFTLEDIYTRYEELDSYLKNKQLPPKDYQSVWDEATVEQRYSQKEISTSAYDEWKKGKKAIGDWRCAYCSMASACKKAIS